MSEHTLRQKKAHTRNVNEEKGIKFVRLHATMVTI